MRTSDRLLAKWTYSLSLTIADPQLLPVLQTSLLGVLRRNLAA